jgi:hypothetical protein
MDQQKKPTHRGTPPRPDGTPKPLAPQRQAPAKDTDSVDASTMPPSSPAHDNRRRLVDATNIVTRSPAISGRELAAELRLRGWSLSDRTASRILPEARRVASSINSEPLPLAKG